MIYRPFSASFLLADFKRMYWIRGWVDDVEKKTRSCTGAAVGLKGRCSLFTSEPARLSSSFFWSRLSPAVCLVLGLQQIVPCCTRCWEGWLKSSEHFCGRCSAFPLFCYQFWCACVLHYWYNPDKGISCLPDTVQRRKKNGKSKQTNPKHEHWYAGQQNCRLLHVVVVTKSFITCLDLRCRGIWGALEFFPLTLFSCGLFFFPPVL